MLTVTKAETVDNPDFKIINCYDKRGEGYIGTRSGQRLEVEPRGRKSGPLKAPTNHPEAARLHTYTSQHILQHALKEGALIQGSFITTAPMARGLK